MTVVSGSGPLELLVIQPTPFCNIDCSYCYLPDRRNTRKITPELRAQIPEIWTEITGNGGGQKELAERLGVTRQRVTQLLDELGLPRRHLAKQRAEEFLEELEHLAGFGLGVYEISRALGLTPDDLVDRVDYLRHHGKTDLNFSTYRLEEAA